MFFPTFRLSPLLAVAAFGLAAVNATPLSRRDVVAPPIITPNAQTVWPIGTTQTVTWYVLSKPYTSFVVGSPTQPQGYLEFTPTLSNHEYQWSNHPRAQLER